MWRTLKKEDEGSAKNTFGRANEEERERGCVVGFEGKRGVVGFEGKRLRSVCRGGKTGYQSRIGLRFLLDGQKPGLKSRLNFCGPSPMQAFKTIPH